MKITTIALAAALAIPSATAPVAPGTSGYGAVNAPSVGSYPMPSVGTTRSVPTWQNTGDPGHWSGLSSGNRS
jgi:hypothetical protein